MVTQRDAYNEGFDTGYGIARFNVHNLAKWGREKFLEECAGAEENARQYSPFEFTAAEFNRSRNPDGLWDAYENGVMAGIKKVMAEANRAQKKTVRRTVGKR